MQPIRAVGQAITSTNYTSPKLFDFNPGKVRDTALNFLAAGVTEIEIPQAVIDPNKRFPETGIDKETLAETLAGIPEETKVVGTYLGANGIGSDNRKYLEVQTRALGHLMDAFPDLHYAMLHPAGKDAGLEAVPGIVETYAKLAEFADTQRPGFQLCFHNHYDSSAENAEQVSAYLEQIEAAALPTLRWGPDTGHCHGMGGEMMAVLKAYVHLIGNAFHIKARVPAFDRLHGAEAYRKERDIWNNEAEHGRGLYSGFVNVADPEIETPFGEIFSLIRASAQPARDVVLGAVEIDIPRQHPRLEALCAILYLVNVHGIETGLNLSNDQIVERVFGGRIQ